MRFRFDVGQTVPGGVVREKSYRWCMSFLRRLALSAAIAALALMGLAAPALAHAAYKDSDPPDEGTVSAPPSQVTAEFTEPLADGSYLQIFGPCGDRVDGGDVSIVGYEMSVSMGGAHAGLYSVNYRAFSQLDPHVTQGTFTFTSTGGDPCPGSEPSDPGPGDDGPRDTGGQDPDPGDPTTTSGDDAGGGAGGGDGGDGSRSSRPGSGGSGGGNRGDSRAGAEDGPEDSVLAQDTGPAPEVATPGVWNGIELGPFLTGLALAMLIGAAGGKIYAGIMGPRA